MCTIDSNEPTFRIDIVSYILSSLPSTPHLVALLSRIWECVFKNDINLAEPLRWNVFGGSVMGAVGLDLLGFFFVVRTGVE